LALKEFQGEKSYELSLDAIVGKKGNQYTWEEKRTI